MPKIYRFPRLKKSGSALENRGGRDLFFAGIFPGILLGFAKVRNEYGASHLLWDVSYCFW